MNQLGLVSRKTDELRWGLLPHDPSLLYSRLAAANSLRYGGTTELEGAQTQHVFCVGELGLQRGTERRRVRMEDVRNDKTCFNQAHGSQRLGSDIRLETRTHTPNSSYRRIPILRDVCYGTCTYAYGGVIVLYHEGSLASSTSSQHVTRADPTINTRTYSLSSHHQH